MSKKSHIVLLALVLLAAIIGSLFLFSPSPTGAHSFRFSRHNDRGDDDDDDEDDDDERPHSPLNRALRALKACCQELGHVSVNWQIPGTSKSVHGKCRSAGSQILKAFKKDKQGAIDAINQFVEEHCQGCVPSTGQPCGCGGIIQCSGSCTNADCPAGSVCDMGVCVPACDPAEGQPCGCGGTVLCSGACSTADCPPGFSCNAGVCVPTCVPTVMLCNPLVPCCSTGFACAEGFCP